MNAIFHAEETQGGYNWTITSKLGHILYTAEQKYGLRDKEYSKLKNLVAKNRKTGVKLYEVQKSNLLLKLFFSIV